MAKNRLGSQTIKYNTMPSILLGASVVGDKESKGPLAHKFDEVYVDEGNKISFELEEKEIFKRACKIVLKKANLDYREIDLLIGGDLLNQIITANFAARELKIPFLGMYGACSTMSESVLNASMIIDGGFADKVICCASSHFCTAERQYRFPLESGNQRPKYAQWTVTGAGSLLVTNHDDNLPYIKFATIGKVVDAGITDANNMGAAMAPAAYHTFKTHFEETNNSPDYYDAIVTGDLGKFGSKMLKKLLKEDGYDIDKNHIDCGNEIFQDGQDVYSGGSGCGCSAVVLASHILDLINKGDLKRVLFASTGALLSPVSTLQGESIPSIAHAIVIEKKA